VSGVALASNAGGTWHYKKLASESYPGVQVSVSGGHIFVVWRETYTDIRVAEHTATGWSTKAIASGPSPYLLSSYGGKAVIAYETYASHVSVVRQK
jgi:hypothetical protein